ncbi:MAG: hypothetical protein CM15mP23_04980 [Cryomorphaceae bacterium]|nr:MAG: hypothetical protein CM15mP23_04980 [Cryomorphaceae bacterium]|tara:strand:- start:824 stop:1345 length:522 start_codon:yes stop_codon:yes gene_type:complete
MKSKSFNNKVKKIIYFHIYSFVLFIGNQSIIQAQDKIYLKDGTTVSGKISEIQDFILYAEVDDDPFLATFFADDVSHLDINPNNSLIIRELKQGVKEAMLFSNPIEDNQLYGFYFGMPYDSVYTRSKVLYQKDSLGNPVLVPYDPMNTTFSERLKSVRKSLTGNTLSRLIGAL